jgi:hypothetical protein
MTEVAPLAEDKPKTGLARVRPWLLGISAGTFAVYGILLVPYNLIAQLVIYGHPVELAPGVESSPYDLWTGHYTAQPAWWLFAASGILYLIVAIIGYPGFENGAGRLGRLSSRFSDDGSLGHAGLVFALVQVGVILTYDGFLSPFDPYAVGPLACLLGAAICYLRWKRRRLPFTEVEARTAQPPSAVARVLGAFKAAVIVLVLIGGPAWIAVNEISYVTTHGGAIPHNSGAAYLTLDEVWPGHLPFAEPWPLVAALSALYFVLFAATWPTGLRQASTPPRPLLFAATTSLSFAGYGFLITLFDVQLGNFSGAPGVLPVVVGPGIALATVLLAIVREIVAPEPDGFVKKRRRRRAVVDA